MRSKPVGWPRAGWVLVVSCWILPAARPAVAQPQPPTFESYLRKSVVDRKTLDVFLDPTELSWAKFDPVTGYRLGNYMPRDGIDGSSTFSSSRRDGARTAHARRSAVGGGMLAERRGEAAAMRRGHGSSHNARRARATRSHAVASITKSCGVSRIRSLSVMR